MMKLKFSDRCNRPFSDASQRQFVRAKQSEKRGEEKQKNNDNDKVK